MDSPLVSIIIPCYNMAEYISETIDSVLRQTYANWECVIVNDGSSDESDRVIRDKISSDPRFSYYSVSNSGVSAARNLAISNSRGEFILPLDGDDLVSPDYIQLAIEAFTCNPKIKVVYCKAELFGVQTGIWNLPAYEYRSFLLVNCIFCSCVFRRTDFDKTGGYREYMRKGLEDWDFLLYLIGENDVIYQIPRVCFYYRIREKSRNASFDDSKKELYDLLYSNHCEIYNKFLDNPLVCAQRLNQYEALFRNCQVFLKYFDFLVKVKGFLLFIPRFIKKAFKR